MTATLSSPSPEDDDDPTQHAVAKNRPKNLLVATLANDTDAIKECLDDPTRAQQQVEKTDRFGQRPLVHAAARNFKEAVQMLLLANADPNARNEDTYETALHRATSENHSDLVQLLLENGAKITPLKNGMNPIHIASRAGHLESLKILLAHESSVVDSLDLTLATPLTLAASHGHTAACIALLEQGAAVEQQDENGWTPFLHAMRNSHAETALELLRRGANREHQTRGGESAVTMNAILLETLAESSENPVEECAQ